MEKAIIEKLRQVYDWLEDGESKDIYLNRLNFLISGDYKYLRYVIAKYVPNLAALNDKAIPELLEKLPPDKDIILYGAGEDAKANLHYFLKDLRFKGFCDKDLYKQEHGFEGFKVISPEDLLKDEGCSIVISTHRGLAEIKDYLQAHGVMENRIYEMTPYMFCAEQGQYFNPDFMSFGEEVFVDAGSNELETVIELKKYCKSIKKAYAFEPDPDNYRKCEENKRLFPDETVKIFPYGTWSERKELFFDSTADGSSHVEETGGISINVVPIDEIVVPTEKVTFIKMDVEGSELESLKGACKTIQKDKPKLAICIYHKAEDMLSIPLYIKSLVPEYRLYVRHHSNGAGETVLYAIL